MSVKAIVIPMGRHTHKGLYWRIPKRLPKRITKKFMFTPSCLFDLGDEDQHDVNKLFGMSFNLFPSFDTLVPHHINSARFGWRPLLDSGTIQIVAYEYYAGVRQTTEVITEVDVGVWYEYTMYWFAGKMYYVVKQGDEFCKLHQTAFPLRRDRVLGYFLDVYFGGNEVAPHKITIFEK